MARQVKLDMTNVETFSKVSEGQHVAKLMQIDQKDSQGGDDMLVAQFEVTKGPDKGGRVFVNFPLIDKALWKFKGFLQAVGIKADGKIRVDLDKLIGKVCIIDVSMGEYNGKLRPQIDSFKKLEAEADTDSDEDEDEDEEEEETPKKKAAPAKKAPPAAKGKKTPPPEDDDEDEEDEDDEDEEEEEPAPKKTSKKSPPPPAKKEPAKKGKKVAEEEDEDDDWDE
jgi:hypothetical protein